ANRAPEHEVDRLMRELKQALERYLQALEKNSKRPSPDQSSDAARTVTSRDLQRMLDEARQLARAGAREQAQALLSQLQGMLETMQMQGRQTASDQATQTMRSMRDMMQRQQQLLDRSLRAEQQGAPDSTGAGEQPTSNGQVGDEAGEQEALRRALGDMMRRLGQRTGKGPGPPPPAP